MDGPLAGLLEKTVSKTNETTQTRELTEAELTAASGGFVIDMDDVIVTNVVKAPVAGFSWGADQTGFQAH